MKKTPLTYYGGKQSLTPVIIPMIPPHSAYIEVFVGGGAVFWVKPPSEVEVINDNNRELINFYEIAQNEFIELEKMVRISLHSRSLHNDAVVIYNNPHMFTRIQRAWAVWVLAAQSFSSKFNGGWGYDKTQNNASGKIAKKRNAFTIEYAQRLQSVQIECVDALRLIRSRDHKTAFFYCDPPYINTHCGHYDGYTTEDFTHLLTALESLEGKFLLSSYPSTLLDDYTKRNQWHSKKLNQNTRVASGLGKPVRRKIEVLTTNYDFNTLPKRLEKLF